MIRYFTKPPILKTEITHGDSEEVFTFFPASPWQLDQFKLAIIGCDETCANDFRDQFYALYWKWVNRFNIIDAGNFAAISNREKAQVVHDFIDAGVLPILIGASYDLLAEIQSVYSEIAFPFRTAVVNPDLRKVLSLIPENIFCRNLYILATQRQFGFHLIHEHDYFQVPLSEFRSKHNGVEPYTRSADLCFMDLDSIRHSDHPAAIQCLPSGLSSEEACIMMKLAGNGDRLRSIIISSWNSVEDRKKVSAKLIAQMVWYFVEGFSLASYDDIYSNQNMSEYVVDIKGTDSPLRFFKSETSGKWWIKEMKQDGTVKNRLFPCTYDEYLSCAQENIPDRLQQILY